MKCTAEGCERIALHENEESRYCRDHLVEIDAPLLADLRVAEFEEKVAQVTGVTVVETHQDLTTTEEDAS